VARTIGFHRLYLAKQPEDDNIKAHWNKLFILARSFPARYWDKFVKKHLRQMGQRREQWVGRREGMRRQRVCARRQKVLLHRVHHPHPGHHPRHCLFLHAYRLLQLGGDEGEVKREREVARRIWFDRLYLSEQPKDDDIKAH
jgi:hypothetical protein